jgi:uracil-DNA glycosylase
MVKGKIMKDIIKSIRSYFEMEKESGVSEYFFSRSNNSVIPAKAGIQKEIDSRFRGNDTFQGDKIKSQVLNCQKCSLSKTRKNVVFGEGNTKARLMFVGEAPGYDEDIQGKPFVGKAGMLLTKIIEAMGFKREDVYICNILKCRPPQNRNPLPEEIALCIDYLNAQIEYVKPEIICGLGKFASRTLLKTDVPITRLRGKWHDLNGIKFMPTYHPAYLLHNPGDKRLVWEDMKKIMEILKE